MTWPTPTAGGGSSPGPHSGPGLGEHAVARDLLEDVVERWGRLLGVDNRRTLAASTAVAESLLQLGDLSAARAVMEEALLSYRRQFGDEHDVTRKTVEALREVTRLGGVAEPDGGGKNAEGGDLLG